LLIATRGINRRLFAVASIHSDPGIEMSGAEELFELRNYFYLGNFAAAITEGETVSLDDHGAQIERDVILKRIAAAQGKGDAVIASVTDSAHVALQAVKLFCTLLKDPLVKDAVLTTVAAWLTDDVALASESLVLMCGIIYAHVGDYDNALRACSRFPQALEHIGVKVQVLLRMDRVDVAEKEVASMQRLDEDATLTQLAAAWVHLGKGGPAAQEAVYIYQDLLERHGATDPILNGLALCHLALGKPDDAERVLQEALAKNPNFPSTLINVVTCAKYRNKPAELVRRYLERLMEVAPSCEWLRDFHAKEAEFDALSAAILA
jgi:coatomer subunit epsilon